MFSTLFVFQFYISYFFIVFNSLNPIIIYWTPFFSKFSQAFYFYFILVCVPWNDPGKNRAYMFFRRGSPSKIHIPEAKLYFILSYF